MQELGDIIENSADRPADRSGKTRRVHPRAAIRAFAGSVLAAFIAASSATSPVAAQETPIPAEKSSHDLILELGAGASVQPAYEGADDYTVQPQPFVALHYLSLPVFGEFGGKPEQGLSVSPSFRVVRERDDSDYSKLRGIGDVDTAVELGGAVKYRWNDLEAYLALRRGVTGHDGFVGETGVNLVTHPTNKLEITAGPRLSFADAEYLQTYLGITPEQAAASGLAVFDPDGGIKGVGASLEARYAFTENWSVVGQASYERLVGDAADSPITDVGSENQFTAALGLTYKFGLDLFD
ncbi:MipA/OmpV family protein [Afifella sp. YEN Y35]|uniref:MipA/OmpV family protein n=1 Tax=Afifella sp. YEN Y35 TaxID=3388337 RepID=UPI0039E1851E